jgi:hypothetical protein
MSKKKVIKWFEAGKSLNWHKTDGQTKRRENALKSRKGNLLKTARALQSLANVTIDEETKRKARADAIFFFKKYNEQKKTKENNNV